EGLFAHNASDRVVKFRISGDGADYFGQSINVVWEEDPDYEITYVQPKLSNLKSVGLETPFAWDSVGGVMVSNSQPIHIDAATEDMIMVNGWAVDGRTKQTASAVFINIDGRLDVPTTYEQGRPDVAAFLKNDNYSFCGFATAIPTSSLEKGTH